MARKLGIALLAALTALALTAGAARGTPKATRTPAASSGATLTVDNDRKDCPNAKYTRIRDAIGAAHDGDTIVVCAGTYVEGPGAVGSNGLQITKSLTIRGAGADKVTIEPNGGKEDRIAETNPDLRSGKGVIVLAKGDKDAPITVHISGVTVDANGVDATAGIVFLDAQGFVDRSLVTGLDVDESADGYTVPGGFRNNAFGIGIAAVTRVRPPASGQQAPIAPRTITIEHTRVERYNAVGVLVDAATSDYSPSGTTPLQASGVPIRAIMTSDEIAGRNSCQNYNDPTAGGPTIIDGDCQASGGSNPIPPPLPLTTGPLFGQDGVRVTAGASVQMSDDTVSSNLVHGEDAPIASVFAPTPNNDPYPLGNHAENNANLRLGGGVRLVGAAASSITDSNIADNAFGVLNTTADGVANNTATPVQAQNNWWGLRTGAVTLPTAGPAVWPSTTAPSATTYNPPIPENPVNGTPVPNAACPAGVSDSNAVAFCPYRSSTQSDQLGGEYPIGDAPIAPVDPGACTSGMQLDPNIPTYDAFFGTVLGGPATGDGLSGTTPSAKKTGQLMSYLEAVRDAIVAHPGTTGSRIAVKLYPAGTSVLGVPMSIIVVGTPDNIANLDSGRNDATFWRGVIDGTTSQADALSQAGVRPAFGWIAGAPHGNEPAGGEASVKELYDLTARTDCANAKRLSNLDVFIQPVTAPDDRDHNLRATAWSFDPNRDRGTIQMPENQVLFDDAVQYPGLFFIDAHQQSSGYFFPPNEDAALHEISHFALDLINDVIGPNIQHRFNDQSSQYRNYNTYDLFVPEYGDTVPSLLMGGAGMTYEKGNNENYGKQVYDHYLAMDETVNAVAAEKTRLVTEWVQQWQEAVDQGSTCKLQDNTQVSPPAVDLLDIGQATGDQNPNVNVCAYYYVPNAHSGDVATTIKELQRAGVNVYRLTAPLTIAGAHRFGNFDINAVQGGLSPALTETTTLPIGTLYIPMDQRTKHWIQAVMGENPFLPFHYFYDKVTWSYSLLRGLAGDGFLTQKPPAGTAMTPIRDPGQGSAPPSAQPVYAFNTDSMAGLAMVNQLLGQGASVSRGAAAFDSGVVHFATGAALVDGASVGLATISADAAKWQTPVYGLSGYPVAHYALALPKIGVYTGGPTAPTNPAFHGTGDGQCTSTAYCEVIFDLTEKEGIPTSQIGQITSTDLASGVLVSQHYTAFVNPSSTIAAGPGATALQAFVNGGGTYVGALTGGTASLRNAGVTTVNTNAISGLTTPGSTFDATWTTSNPVAWGFDAGGWIYRETSGDPVFDPATLGGNGTTIPAATAVATYAAAGDCGGPAGFGNCYGYEVNANANLSGRPAVIDQPFGAGHAIMLGFDAWFRAWTTQDERLVLNAVLYPTGSAIPAGTTLLNRTARPLHASSPTAPLSAGNLPRVEPRPPRATRPSGLHFFSSRTS
jgi:Zinc carboxypeptidase